MAPENFTDSAGGAAVDSGRRGIRAGEMRPLPYRPVWGANRCHMIAHEEIERFIRGRIVNPRPRHQWRWERMPEGWFRNFAATVAKGGA